MAKVLVFVDHDIMVRHFLQSGVLAPLEADHEVVYVFPEAHRRVTVDLASLPMGRYRTVPVSNERVHAYRRLYHASVLKRMRRSSDKAVVYGFWYKTLGRRAFWASWCCSWPGVHAWYRRRMLARIGRDAALDALLAEEKPDVIVHPTVLEGLFVSDLVRWGQAHAVPTVYLMNSWDNPALKALMTGEPDRLVVWGEHSVRLAHERLGIAKDRIVAFGAAQFDVYRRPPRETPAGFRRRVGIDDGRRILLYAGSSKGLNETAHLQMLDEAIERGDLPRCVVLYRPHPWRARMPQEADFFVVPWRHVVMTPDMAEYYRRKRRGETTIHLADYEETHTTLGAVDAVISPLSTILLEAALHGKPILAYLPDEDLTPDHNVHVFAVVTAVHFRDFFARVDCLRCESRHDLVRDCRRVLDAASDAAVGERLRRQCEYFVAPTRRSYAEQLRDLVAALVPRPARTPAQVL
jgi:hypothetical protein